MDSMDNAFEPSEDFEHLAQAHKARPQFRNPVQLMKMKMGEGCIFDIDDVNDVDYDFDDGEEEEVYDEDTMAIFNFQAYGEDERKSTTGYFDVDRFAHTDFLSTEEHMEPLNSEETVKKMVIRTGSGEIKIPERSKVYFHYTAISEGASEAFDTSMIQKSPCVVDLRTDSTIPGLTLALKSMALSEIARFIMYPQVAFGEVGCPPRIPKNSKVMYVIQLLQFIDEARLNTTPYMSSEERNDLPFQTIIEESKKMRGEGNRHYADTSYFRAVKMWRKAINILEDYLVTDNEGDKARRELLGMLYSNLAQGFLKMERPAQACNACKVGLKAAEETDPACVKLYFRFAKAKLMLKDPDAALGLIYKALKIEPSNNEAWMLKQEILTEKNRMNNAFKKTCRRMFPTSSSQGTKKAGGTVKAGGNVKAGATVKAGAAVKAGATVKAESTKESSLEVTPESGVDLDLFVKDFEYCSVEDLEKMRAEIANSLENVPDGTHGPSSVIDSALASRIPKPPTKLKNIFYTDFKEDEEATDDEE